MSDNGTQPPDKDPESDDKKTTILFQKEDLAVCKEALESIRHHYRAKLNAADKRIRFLEGEFLKADEDKVYWRSRCEFLIATSQNILKRNQLELDNRKDEINYLNSKVQLIESDNIRNKAHKGTGSSASSPGFGKRSTSEVEATTAATSDGGDEETKLLVSTREKQLERLAVQLDGLNNLCQQQSEIIEDLRQTERSHKDKVMTLNEKVARLKAEIESLSRKLAMGEKSTEYQKSLTTESSSSPGGPLTGISSLTSAGASSTSRGGLFLFRLPPRQATAVDDTGLINFLVELRAEVNQLALHQDSDHCEAPLK